MTKVEREEICELKANIQILKEQKEQLEKLLIRHEKTKRVAIGQKIEMRENLEDLMQWIIDRANDNNRYVEFNINTLREEFNFFRNYHDSANNI